ncbi:MAPK/MAK/MRK overlapping kinase-like [Osmerus eperlanus]|uniref:MAPK/MAK/MRK overlapping kinase-like n=1 Tax=Osmerus eperlanus TaxID=29151 RepID=UPI002E0EED1F
MNKYRTIKKIGEGTYAVVVKAKSLEDGKCYACKTLKHTLRSWNHVYNLREVQALRRLGSHPNLLQLHDILFDLETGSVSLVFELMEMNIFELIKARQYPMPESKIQNYMYQLCKSLHHLHSNGIFHRDVKPENILIKHNTLKLGDFGSCNSLYAGPPYTEYISTRWYRAPECLLTDGHYSHKMDLWSAGCVFYEILTFRPLFPGSSELDQVSKIHDVLGTPKPAVLRKFKPYRKVAFNFTKRKGRGLSALIPQCSETSMSLLRRMLQYDPEERISSRAALQHLWFREQRLEERIATSLTRKTSMDLERGQRSTHTPSAGDNQKHRTRQACQAVKLPRLNQAIHPSPRACPDSLPFCSARGNQERLPPITNRINRSTCQKPREEVPLQAKERTIFPPLGNTNRKESRSPHT